MPDTITASFTLKLEGRLLDFAVAVPSRPITLRELLPSLFELNRQLLDNALDREAKAGRRISCRPGCGACCRQLDPTGAIETALMRRGVAGRPNAQAATTRPRPAPARAQLEGASPPA